MLKNVKTLIKLAGGNVVIRNKARETISVIINFQDIQGQNCIKNQWTFTIQPFGGQKTIIPYVGCQFTTMTARIQDTNIICNPQEFPLSGGQLVTISDNGPAGNCLIR